MPGRPKPDSDEYISPRERLARTGYEANVGEDITEEYPPRTLKICLHLSESGYNALLAGFTQEVLDQQREIWIQTKRKNQEPPLEILTDISAREALYEIIAMRPCQEEAEPAGEDCCCCEEEEECCDMACKCGCCNGATDAGTVQPPELGGPPVGTGGKGGGTGGSPGDGPGGKPGSGPDGGINPDGKDTELVGNSCVDIGSPPNQQYNSPGFELANLDITDKIKAAIATLPNYQTGDTIVSAALQVDGLCWTGFSIVGGPLIPTRKLSVTDSKNAKHLVAFTEERGGLSVGGVGVSSLSYRYADSFAVDLSGPNPVKIDGQMPRSSIGEPFGEAGKDSPAWLTCKVCSAIVRHKADVEQGYGFNFSFGPSLITPQGYWDDSGINIRAYFTQFTHYGPNDTWNSDYIVTGATGGVPGQSRIILTKMCDLAYTKLSGSFRHGNAGYTPTITLQFEQYNPNTGDLIATVGAPLTIGPLASTGAVPGDYENNLPKIDYSLTFPALTPGNYYRLLFALDAGIGLDNLVGNFAV